MHGNSFEGYGTGSIRVRVALSHRSLHILVLRRASGARSGAPITVTKLHVVPVVVTGPLSPVFVSCGLASDTILGSNWLGPYGKPTFADDRVCLWKPGLPRPK